MKKVCTWCATVINSEQPNPDCPKCASEGHLYRMVDDGPTGFAWLRDRWQKRNWTVGLARLANAEEAYHAARAV